jgi:hypothetical protein
MSDIIETKTPLKPEDFPSVSPETIQDANAVIEADKLAKRKEREAKINARIEELKSFEGKTFARNDGTGLPVKVLKYAGMFLKEGRMIYTFEAETPGHAAWKPSATDFLAEYHVIETAATETEVEPY